MKSTGQNDDKPACDGICKGTLTLALNGGNECRLRLRDGLQAKKTLSAASPADEIDESQIDDIHKKQVWKDAPARGFRAGVNPACAFAAGCRYG